MPAAAAPSRFLRLPDGSVWPRPSLSSDDEVGLEWKLRYAPDSLTREDQLLLASIVSGYGHLIAEATKPRRDEVCRQVLELLRAEVAQ